MNRRFFYLLRIIINLFRVPFLRLISLNKIKCSLRQIISPATKIRAYKNGLIQISKMSVIEENVLLEANGGELIIEGGFINRNTTIVSMEKITIGPKVTIGPNVCIYDHDHNISCKDERPFITSPIIINEGVWIGAGAIILKGVTIGKGAVVAAGAVVTTDVKENTIVKGVPAK